jgi:hypothetical protein
MHGWEYVYVEWGYSFLTLWPSEKFDPNWIKQKIGSALKEVKAVPDKPPPGTLPYYFIGLHKHRGNAVGAAIIQHLGSERWEAISISGDPTIPDGGAWLKRPLTE